jgi:hypothetical protein
MAWQGIPFSAGVVESLIINKLPTITLDTPFAWDTVLGSFIAGAIPAIIAWLAIKNNFKLSDRQAKRAEKLNLEEKLRIASLDYLCSIESVVFNMTKYLARDYKTYDHELGYPEYFQEALDLAQKNERYLLLLVKPDERSNEFLEAIIKVNKSVQPFVTLSQVSDECPKILKKAADNFIFCFHKYIQMHEH